MMKYHFKIHKEKIGYWAQCIELEGCSTQASTQEKLMANMYEALNLFLSEPENSNYIFPRPRKIKSSSKIKEVEVDISIAVANAIRELRLKNKLTQKKMMEELGLKFLSNYQRLENPKKSNPVAKTLSILKKKFPEFSIDDIFV